MTHTLSMTFYCGECTTQTSPAAFVGRRSDALLLRWWMDGCHTEVKAALLPPPLSPHCRSHRKLWPTLLLPNHRFFSIHHITVLLKPLSEALKFLIQLLLPFSLNFAGEMIVIAWCQTYQSHQKHFISSTRTFSLILGFDSWQLMTFYCNNDKKQLNMLL